MRSSAAEGTNSLAKILTLRGVGDSLGADRGRECIGGRGAVKSGRGEEGRSVDRCRAVGPAACGSVGAVGLPVRLQRVVAARAQGDQAMLVKKWANR